MDAAENAVVVARIELEKEEEHLDSEDETYLDNEEIAHRQNMKDQDLLYEEDVLRNPYNLKGWWRYIQAKKGAKPAQRNLLFERAVKELPGSYKLWCDEPAVAERCLRGMLSCSATQVCVPE
jgi:hypothetical protein